MERLTAIENGYAYYPKCFEEPCNGDGCKNDECEMRQQICEKLAEYEDTKLEPEDIATDYEMACIFAMQQKLKHYEDLANQGRLVELPCKVGDTVYYPYIDFVTNEKVMSEWKVCGIAVKEDGIYALDEDNSFNKIGDEYCYLTREEAENVLSELQNEA